MTHRALPTHDAALVALLLATNPRRLGGVSIRGMPSPERDDWLKVFRGLLPNTTPWLKVPVNVSEDRLLGGLDFAATLSLKKPVFATGLLEAANGGVLVLSMAERLPESAASMIGDTLDRCELLVERDGARRECETFFSVVAIDEGMDDDEHVADALSERLAFGLSARNLIGFQAELADWTVDDVIAAQSRLETVRVPDAFFTHFSQTAAAFGLSSLRGDIFMLSTARTLAALDGCDCVSEEHAAIAARLVLPQRATRMPAEAEPSPPQEPESPPEESSDPADSESRAEADSAEQEPKTMGAEEIPEDLIVEAILASLPIDVLEELAKSIGRTTNRVTGGRGGPATRSKLRGRPVGVDASKQIHGARLNVLATLKAAAPWQALRRREGAAGVLELRPSDLRITRFKDRVETTTIFVVDASGSQAAQRLAEAKGAIELLLADCYVRRDQVALIAFRRDAAEILLEPTRALARVKRSLSALPGGGGTPLASGIDTARQLADSIARQGRTAAIVLMTDGRANVARDSTPGAGLAERDALDAARLFRLSGLKSLLVDTSRRPKPRARTLADAMGAGYIALPNATADRISSTVQRNLTP